MLDILRIGRSPTEHIEQLELKSQAMAQNDHVVGVKIPMVLALVVNRFDTQGERMQQVSTLKRILTPSRLALQKIGEQFPFDKF